MIATLMQALDSTIANVALPHMQGSLSASRDQITWVLTSYVIAAAVMTAPVGWLAARFGRKNFFVACLTGFTITSMLCAIAQSLPEMVIFRLMQGACGAALVPLSQSIMLDIYPPEKRGSAMAVWGVGVMVGPILGPTLGGYLTELYNWRWVFFINVPFGIAAIAGLWLFLKEPKGVKTLRFDWMGFLALAVALTAFQFMLDRGGERDWFESPEIIIEAIIAGSALYIFLVHIFTAEKPFIPLRIFTDVGFVSGLFIMFAMGLVLLASSALLPPYLQNLGGYSVEETGLLMTPRGFGTMLSMMLMPALAKRFDVRVLAGLGAAVMAWAMYEMSTWTPAVDVMTISLISGAQGVGMGLIFMAVQMVGFATLEPVLRTDGTALYSLIRNIGMAIGVSISTVVLAFSIQTVHSELSEFATPFNRVLNNGITGMFWSPGLQFGLEQLNTQINQQAAIIAYANDFLLMCYISLPIIPLLFLMRKPLPVPKDEAEAMVME